jgi:hypothetical protein
MKKIIVAFLAVLYLGMSSGMAMTIHFCRGKLAQIDFFSQAAVEAKKGCGKCTRKLNKKPPCCKDQYQFVKVDDAHKKAEVDASIIPFVVALAHTFFIPPVEAIDATRVATPIWRDPPPPHEPARQELYCIYRL